MFAVAAGLHRILDLDADEIIIHRSPVSRVVFRLSLRSAPQSGIGSLALLLMIHGFTIHAIGTIQLYGPQGRLQGLNQVRLSDQVSTP